MNDFIQAAAEFPSIIGAAVFCIGACVGSFLNVCILRIPKGESIVSPPSHCKCGAPIKWFDNIPILSWFVLRGKARCCGGRISFRYPLVEALTAALFLLLWLTFPPTVAAVYMLFAALMVFCTFVDLDTMTLPDAATVGGAILGVVAACAVPEMLVENAAQMHPLAAHVRGFGYSVFGCAVSSGVLYWIRLLAGTLLRREAMGEGDVILVGCIGAFCGWQGGLFALFGGSIIGCAVMIPTILISRGFSKNSGEIEIPFGPWLAAGAVVYIFCADFVRAALANFYVIFE